MKLSITYLHAELENQNRPATSLAVNGPCDADPASRWSFENPSASLSATCMDVMAVDRQKGDHGDWYIASN